MVSGMKQPLAWISPVISGRSLRKDTLMSLFSKLPLCLVSLALVHASPGLAKAPNCTASQAKAADKWLWLSPRDKKLSIVQNLPWGEPLPIAPVSNEELLVHWDFVIDYDDDLHIPMWTGERVVGKKLGNTTRSDCFRPDPRLPVAVASMPKDYDEPLFDQGHVTPSADVTSSKISVWNSFVMSNMTPQYGVFNRGIWRKLEDYMRRLAIANGTAYILTGSILDRNNDGLRDADADASLMKPRKGTPRVAIPTAFYKVIAIEQPDHSLRTLAFILPNTPLDVKSKDALTYLSSKIVRLDAIERLTATDLFPANPTIAESEALWPMP